MLYLPPMVCGILLASLGIDLSVGFLMEPFQILSPGRARQLAPVSNPKAHVSPASTWLRTSPTLPVATIPADFDYHAGLDDCLESDQEVPEIQPNPTLPQHQREDQNTVSTFTTPTGQKISLIGTAHLSEKSSEQVRRLIQDIQPNAVLVELDKKRLNRLGIRRMKDIPLARVITSEQISLPETASGKGTKRARPWSLIFHPHRLVQEAFSEAVSRMTRASIADMYSDMSHKMQNQAGSGGEFLAAIQAAANVSACDTLILGDRPSLTTIRRATTLAMQSGDPMGALTRFQQAHIEEMRRLELKVRDELQTRLSIDLKMDHLNQEIKKEDQDWLFDEQELTVAMMEAIKDDTEFRDSLFQKLEEEVPEFTQAFLTERDYIMAEAIRRELEDQDVQRVVGVVGLAHVSGIVDNLQEMYADQPATKKRKIELNNWSDHQHNGLHM